MTLVGIRAIEKLYGGRAIFRGLDWTIEDGARTGLIGPNGGGKSTLLRIIAGLEEVQAGQVTRQNGLRIAYLPQHVEGDEQTPMQVTLSGREDLATVDAELNACAEALGSPEVSGDLRRMERVLAQQERALRRYEELGGPGSEGEARSRLLELGLSPADLAQPMVVLSGGQRKIVALAACLIQRPQLLLLDEPETHLDLPHRARLESLIRDFGGAVVIVSHDRYLLDETVGDIAELEDGRLKLWSGNYSAYAVARELAMQRQTALYAAQQKDIARLEEAIARFKQWAHQVVNERHIRQARVKQMQIDRMDKVERPVLERRKMALRLQSQARGGQKVVELRRVTVTFDAKQVVRDVSLGAWRGQRIGIIGANGAGKSVLARLLSGQLRPDNGDVWTGPSIDVGYFSQSQETLPLDATPIDLVRSVKPLREDQAIGPLMRFLFTYEQARLPVVSLSGGERSRLQLLLLMLGGANCLVLDEPTNHLDIDSLEVLESALDEYDGTVIVISHDRYFLDRIVDRIVEVRDGRLLEHAGGYSDWLVSNSCRNPESRSSITEPGHSSSTRRSAPSRTSTRGV